MERRKFRRNYSIRDEFIEKEMNRISKEKKVRRLTDAVSLISPDYSKATYLNAIIIEYEGKQKIIHASIIANYGEIPKDIRKKCESQEWPPKSLKNSCIAKM